MKKPRNAFKSILNEISRGINKSEDHKTASKILNHFNDNGRLLLNYLMFIFQLYLRVNTKKVMTK